MADTVPLTSRVDSLVADALLVQDAQRRLDLLDQYLALPSEHPHPQIMRVRNDHYSQVGEFDIEDAA